MQSDDLGAVGFVYVDFWIVPRIPTIGKLARLDKDNGESFLKFYGCLKLDMDSVGIFEIVLTLNVTVNVEEGRKKF